MNRASIGKSKQDSLSSDVLIVGAGPAGLATAACVKQRGLNSIVLERSDRIAPSWYRHYDRLHLHTHKGSSSLPYLRMPKRYPRYPSRQQVIEYLESYANSFGIRPHFRQDVIEVNRKDGMWQVITEEAHFSAPHLVLATGYARIPNLPIVLGQDSFTGNILHSSFYRSGTRYQGKQVLVVGFGNSGGEIALDLLENGAHTSLSVRGPVNIIPRDIFGIPIVSLAVPLGYLPTRFADILTQTVTRLKYGDLKRYGLKPSHYGPLMQIKQDSRIPVIDVGTIAQIKRGNIKVYSRLINFRGEEVVFADGSACKFDTVIMATGYKSNLPFPLPVDSVSKGKALGLRESRQFLLYFCGYNVVPTGMLREIGREALKIAADISTSVNEAQIRSSLANS